MIGEIWPELPELYSSMFQQKGSLTIRKNDIITTDTWKIDLWEQTVVFYCKLYGMSYVVLVNDAMPDIYTLRWGPNG